MLEIICERRYWRLIWVSSWTDRRLSVCILLHIYPNPTLLRVWTILYKDCYKKFYSQIYIQCVCCKFNACNYKILKNRITFGQKRHLMRQKRNDRKISLSHCGSSVPKKLSHFFIFYRFEIYLIEWGIPEHSLITCSTLILRRKQQIDFYGVSWGARWTQRTHTHKLKHSAWGTVKCCSDILFSSSLMWQTKSVSYI